MPIKIIILIFIFISASSLSCARKQTATGKIRLNLGAATAGTTLNGVYIWGLNKTFGLTFGAHIVGDGRDIELPLKPGVWSFRVVAWSGAGLPMFAGTTRCGNSPDISFQSGDVDVPIHINSDCSNHPYISAPEFVETPAMGNQLKQLRLITCRSLALAKNDTDLCSNAYLGETKSFRVILPSYSPRPDLEIGPFAPDSLKSDCQNTTDGLADTNLRIPVGNGAPESPRVYIEAFDQPGCGGTPQFRAFPHGLFATVGINGKLINGVNGVAANRSVFFLKHGEALGKGDLSVFGNGSDGIGNWNGVPDPVDQTNSKVQAYPHRVTSITSDPAKPGMNNIGIPAGDNLETPYFDNTEIMWHVSIEAPSGACGSPQMYAGNYGFAKAYMMDATTLTVEHDFGGVNNTNLNANIQFSNPDHTSYPVCVMQVIRVPNFQAVTVSGGTTLNTVSFTTGVVGPGIGRGGIMAIRVQNKLTISAPLTLTAQGRGYPWGTPNPSNLIYSQGIGPDGFTTESGGVSCGSLGIYCDLPSPGLMADPLGKATGGMGGGVGHGGVAGGGGGANVGNGGAGSTFGGAIAGQGGLGRVPSIGPIGPIHMGASGGHGNVTSSIAIGQGGGAGGGIILIYAREIEVQGSAVLSVSANGLLGDTNGESHGGGGGAGGTIFVTTQYFSSPTPMGLSATGGLGGNGVSSGQGGGGGGGGRIYFRGCMGDQVIGSALSYLIGGGVAGLNPGGGFAPFDGAPGRAGDEKGANGNVWNASFPFCP